MAQDRAQLAITPFLALSKSATSPRAASDLIAQVTTAQGTFTFADLLSQPNIEALKRDQQYSSHYELLEIFAWGTWETYTQRAGLPKLNDQQALKLRLLSLLSYAAEKRPDLSYNTLCNRLQLSSAVDLEHLITTAIYSDLLSATLNPATQLVQITSVAPVRDLGPGSVMDMLQELEQWSARCDSVLVELESEVSRVKMAAAQRAAMQAKTEKQIAAATEANDRSTSSVAGRGNPSALGGMGAQRLPRMQRKEQGGVDEEADDDAMDIDGQGGTSRKRSLLGRLKGK